MAAVAVNKNDQQMPGFYPRRLTAGNEQSHQDGRQDHHRKVAIEGHDASKGIGQGRHKLAVDQH